MSSSLDLVGSSISHFRGSPMLEHRSRRFFSEMECVYIITLVQKIRRTVGMARVCQIGKSILEKGVGSAQCLLRKLSLSLAHIFLRTFSTWPIHPISSSLHVLCYIQLKLIMKSTKSKQQQEKQYSN